MLCFINIDNGPHYHNSGFLLYLSEVNAAFNIHLIEYNNFEAGEGKSKLNTHFAHVSHKIVRWVRVGNNLESGSQLGELIGVCELLLCFIKCYYFKLPRLKLLIKSEADKTTVHVYTCMHFISSCFILFYFIYFFLGGGGGVK